MDNRPLYNGCLAKKRKRESILIEEIKNAPKERAEEMIKSLHSENNSEHWSQVRKVLNYYYSLLIKDEIFVSVVNTAIKKKDFEIVNSYLKNIYSELSPSSELDLTIAKKYIGVLYYDFAEESISQEIYITDNLPYIQNVYKKINTGGKTLNTEENAWSQLFKMKDLESDGFSFKHKSIDLSNQIFQKYGIILKPVFILNSTAYCLSGNIFTNTILSLSLKEVIEQWDLICQSIIESVDFMKKYFHIENSSGLGNMIIAFSKFFYEKNTEKDLSLKQIKYLKSFYYTLMFRNDKDTLTRMKDLEFYSKWMNNIAKGNFESFSNYIEYPTFENFTDYNTVLFKDNSSLKSKVLQAYKSLMFERNPLSLVSGNIIKDDSLESKEKLNLDHIFPKANKGKKANNIFNIAILDFDTNRDKSVKAPSTVFSFPNQKGYEEGYDFNDEIKKSHFLDNIPDEIYINDKYDDFVKLRSQNMFDYLESEFFSL